MCLGVTSPDKAVLWIPIAGSVNKVCCHSKCVQESNCARRSCSFADQVCCHLKCDQGSSCLGQRCTFDSDCSANQACFNSKCNTGKNCLRQRCYNFNSDCSSGQSCCSGNCTEGLTCIGKSCISEKNCQAADICCWGTCSKVKCKDSGIACFVGPIAAFLVIVLIIAIFLVYRRRRVTRRRPVSRDITSNITAPTHDAGITINILEEDYPLYQPQRPTFDQHFESNTESEQLLPCDLIPTH